MLGCCVRAPEQSACKVHDRGERPADEQYAIYGCGPRSRRPSAPRLDRVERHSHLESCDVSRTHDWRKRMRKIGDCAPIAVPGP